MEVIVLVFLLAFFVAVVMSVLNRPRPAPRMPCGANLAGLGKAMLIYAGDNAGELPRAGGGTSAWALRTPDWAAPDQHTAFDLAADGSRGRASVSASLYLLVKYCDVSPKTFICGGSSRRTREKGMREFRLGMYRVPNKKARLIDFWDFGPNPPIHCSYAYHMPYGPYKLTTSDDPGLAVAADRNPWMDSPSTKAGDFTRFRPDGPSFSGTAEQARRGNTFRHDGDGQNILFLDGHVEFAKRAYCGVDDDNIYTVSTSPTAGDPTGTPPKLGSQPANRKDSLLVNDPPVSRK